MRHISMNREAQQREYRAISKKYLALHPFCELFCVVEGRRTPSDQVHHCAGREGRLLCDTRFFRAACSGCHPRRVHETEVACAKELGFLFEATTR